MTSTSSRPASQSLGTDRMWWTLGLNVAAAALFLVLWYCFWARWNRSRARHLLDRIEIAFGGYGQVCGIHWLSASEFQVKLRLRHCAFINPTMVVRLIPREFPVNWVVDAWKKRRESLDFQADMLVPPSFNLEVQNQRWHARIRQRHRTAKAAVHLKRLGPCILTSRRQWQKEITGLVQALSTSRDCELLSVSFRRSTPHFSASVALESIDGQHSSPVGVFDRLRELASGASAARP